MGERKNGRWHKWILLLSQIELLAEALPTGLLVDQYANLWNYADFALLFYPS